MAPDPAARAGFARPSDYPRSRSHRRAMLAQLIATSALIASLAVAVTAVSIGIARAGVPAPMHGYAATLVIAGIVAEVLSGMGGLAAIAAHDRLCAKSGARRRE